MPEEAARAMLDTPFPPWPDFTEEEARAVARVLASNRVNYWTGPEGREFEREFAEWAGARIVDGSTVPRRRVARVTRGLTAGEIGRSEGDEAPERDPSLVDVCRGRHPTS